MVFQAMVSTPTRLAPRPIRRSGPLPLPSLRGEVHRFSGVVDRFGSFSRNGETEHTICIRNLRLADRDQDLDLDHWWFRLREVWTEAGVRVGDTVLFTAKVQRCSKGFGDPAGACLASHNGKSRLREQVVGFGTCPRSVVVLRRRQTTSRLVEEMASEKACSASQLAVTEGELQLLQQHRQALLADTERLQGVLTATTGRLEQETQTRMRLQASLRRLQRKAVVAALLALTLGGAGGVVLAQRLAPSAACLPTAPRS
jgi:hypothetical protein